MHLISAPYVVIAAAGHPDIAAAGIGPREAIPLDLFCRFHHVVRLVSGIVNCVVDGALAKVGRRLHVALIIPHTLAVAVATAHGRHLAIVPLQFAELMAPRLGLQIYESPVPLPAADIHAFWHSRHDDDPAHKWLRRQIMSARDTFELRTVARDLQHDY